MTQGDLMEHRIANIDNLAVKLHILPQSADQIL